MNCYKPHTFSACEYSNCGNPAICSEHMHMQHNLASRKYARVFVKSQTYENILTPECALSNGTIFKDLYMPYIPEEYMCQKEKGVRQYENMCR